MNKKTTIIISLIVSLIIIIPYYFIFTFNLFDSDLELVKKIHLPNKQVLEILKANSGATGPDAFHLIFKNGDEKTITLMNFDTLAFANFEGEKLTLKFSKINRSTNTDTIIVFNFLDRSK
jgi:hypothetical protein